MTTVLGHPPPTAIDGYPVRKSLVPLKHLLYLRISHAVEVVRDFNLSGHEPLPTGRLLSGDPTDSLQYVPRCSRKIAANN